MESNLINERIMLARAYPGSNKKNDLGFSSVLKEQVAKKPQLLQASETKENFIKPAPKKTLQLLGTLSESRPTVSNILIKDPQLGKECWQIIHNKINKDKPFTQIMAGTKIYINPETKELLWGNMVPENPATTIPQQNKIAETPTLFNEQVQDMGSFSEKLVDAVKPYLGKDYNDINCYELIIKGLKQLGVQYQGAGGLGHKLIKMAIEKGLPINAYFNGEGLVKASGSKIYSKSILNIEQAEHEALEIIDELTPILEKGLILSFSTPTKGHTGIISKKDDLWTFINSGDMDNIIGQNNLPKGVGEENLIEEIINWFKLAESRNENLRISVGKLNEKKLSVFNENRRQGIRNV